MAHQLFLSSPCCFSLKTQLHSHQPHHHLSLTSHSFIINPNFTFSKLYKNWAPLVSSSIPFLSSQSSDYFEQSSFKFSSSYSPTSTPGVPPKVFVGHSIYKGKAALTVEPRAPEFVPLDSGAFKISEGFILLQFAPAAGVRQYDWSRKQVFSLSVTEIGSLVSLGARESCEFFMIRTKEKVMKAK